MSVPTPETWAQLIADYEAARERWASTNAALEALPVESGFDSEEERIHEEARLALDQCEERLLSVRPPDLSGAAYQLKIFAERFHGADVEDGPMSGEDQFAGEILRRVYGALRAGSRGCRGLARQP